MLAAMNSMLISGKSVRRDQAGNTAIEYALIMLLIAATIILAITLTGQKLNRVYCYVAAGISGAGVYSGQYASCIGSPTVQVSNSWLFAGYSNDQVELLKADGSIATLGGLVGLGQVGAATPNAGFVSYKADSTPAGTPWSAVTSNAAEAAAFAKQCGQGSGPMLYDSTQGAMAPLGAPVNQGQPGVKGGVAVESTVSNTPMLQLLAMGYDHSGTFVYQPSQIVVTCQAP